MWDRNKLGNKRDFDGFSIMIIWSFWMSFWCPECYSSPVRIWSADHWVYVGLHWKKRGFHIETNQLRDNYFKEVALAKWAQWLPSLHRFYDSITFVFHSKLKVMLYPQVGDLCTKKGFCQSLCLSAQNLIGFMKNLGGTHESVNIYVTARYKYYCMP